MRNKVFALSGDYGYIDPITTTIKSVIYHNTNSKIYLINSDIPQEWFKVANFQLANSRNQIIDVKIEQSYLSNEHVGLDHIHPIAYGKILLPDLLQEDRVIYLDSDLIINSDLTPLFNLDMHDHVIACAPDVDEHNGHFNTGVIVYDLAKARSIPKLVHDELMIGQNQNLRNADQDVMNEYFKDDFYQLSLDYNYQIGMDWIAFYNHHDYFYDLMNPIKNPKIIHYLTPDKPWKTVSSSRLRELWWQYYALTFHQIVNHEPLPKFDPMYKGRLFTFLTSQNMGILPQLIEELPDYQFNIGAWSNFGEPVIKLLKYPNTRLYPTINGPQLNQLYDTCNAYLDVNHDGKERKVLDAFEQRKKPIIAAEDVANNIHNYNQYRVFAVEDLQGFVNNIRSL